MSPFAILASHLPLQDLLHVEHRVECPIKCLAGALYVRISAAVYNELADYEALAAAVEAITQGL